MQTTGLSTTYLGLGISPDARRYPLYFTPGTTKQDKDTGQWTANIRTQQMEMRLSLTIQVWTPEGIDGKPKAHLEGHRKIV